MSFEKITPLETKFVALENYKKLLSDTVFLTAIKNSATYMFWTLVLLIPFPMLFAVLMDSNLVKAKGVWKAVLYMPALTSVVISASRLLHQSQQLHIMKYQLTLVPKGNRAYLPSLLICIYEF